MNFPNVDFKTDQQIQQLAFQILIKEWSMLMRRNLLRILHQLKLVIFLLLVVLPSIYLADAQTE